MGEGAEAVWGELKARWRQVFRALAEGGEVPPSRRLRTEGMMEALVLQGHATEAEVQEAMFAVYGECGGPALPEDWRELFPFPQVPGFGRRAPVYPSTKD